MLNKENIDFTTAERHIDECNGCSWQGCDYICSPCKERDLDDRDAPENIIQFAQRYSEEYDIYCYDSIAGTIQDDLMIKRNNKGYKKHKE